MQPSRKQQSLESSEAWRSLTEAMDTGQIIRRNYARSRNTTEPSGETDRDIKEQEQENKDWADPATKCDEGRSKKVWKDTLPKEK